MEWQELIRDGVRAFNAEYKLTGPHHVGTPERVVKAYAEMASGYWDDPGDYLQVQFPVADGSHGMVHVSGIRINATCAHHHLPIIGLAHFAYLPATHQVGLSKIPRFIQALSRRLVIQETLCANIVDVFQGSVRPHGCAVWMKAFHCCMSSRGVLEHQAITTTMEVRGAFRENGRTRQEFLANINVQAVVIG